LENLETNPEELEKLQFKLDLLNRQMQKHKVNSVSDLIKIEKQLAERLKKTLNVSSQLDELKKTEKKLEKLLHSLVKKIDSIKKRSCPNP